MLLDLTESQVQTLRNTVDYLLTKDFNETLTLSEKLLKDQETTNRNLRSIRQQLEPKKEVTINHETP